MADFSKFLRGVQDIAKQAEEAATSIGRQISEAANQAYEEAGPKINDAAQNLGSTVGYAYGVSAEKVGEAADYIKEQAQALGDNAANVVSLDEIGRKIASLGTPAIAFAVAASIAGGMGLAGGAVITTALAMLGGPFGMIGGLMVLGVLTVIADAVGKYGIESVLEATFRARREQGMTDEQIFQEIDNLWLSEELKLKIKDHLQKASKQ
jgi:hypothetical protein